MDCYSFQFSKIFIYKKTANYYKKTAAQQGNFIPVGTASPTLLSPMNKRIITMFINYYRNNELLLLRFGEADAFF